MTVAQAIDANPYRSRTWKAIEWIQAQRTVRRIQTRIVKAIQEGAHRTVKDLQRLLKRSFAAKLLAVKRVTTNKGCKTAGVDRVIWKTPEQKLKAAETLRSPIHSQPLRRVYIPKKNGKRRPLGIPTMLDRAHQALHLLTLEPIAETTADSHSYGFRVGRSAADAMQYIYVLLEKRGSANWILEGDIKACFDEISHEWIEENIPMEKETLHRWLKAGYMEKNQCFPTKAGTPQGGIASPVLANMTLDGLEKTLRDTFGSPRTRRARRRQIHFCRYCDDFIVTGSSKELLETEVKPVIEQFLLERGLKLSEEKTTVTHIDQGFDFLGQNVRKYKGRLIIKPSKKSVQSIMEKLKFTVQQCEEDAATLIKKLNPMIRGWCNYHRHVVSSSTFSKLGSYLFTLLWKWSKRRHLNKGRRWIARKYFLRPNQKCWKFSATNEKNQTVTLYTPSSTRIKKHILIRGQANPYDKKWQAYFERKRTREVNGKNFCFMRELWEYLKKTCCKCSKTIEDYRKAVLHFPQDNIAVDKEIPLYTAKLVHRECHE